jgi:hypothetical protein
MPVDVSMYPGPPKPVNPLEMMSSMAGLQGQMQQNQIAQRAMMGQQAEGQAAQAATGEDGSFDPGKFAAGVASNPNGVYAQVHANAFAQEQRQAQLAQHVQQVQLGMQQTQYMTDQLGALADKKGVTGKDVADLAGVLVQNGILDSKSAATELAQAPTSDDQLPAYLRTLQMRAMKSGEQLAQYHQQMMIDNGAQLVPTNMAPLATPSPIVKQLSPGEAAQPVAGPVTADGAPTQVSLGNRGGGVVQTGQGPAATQAQGTYGAATGTAAAQFEAAARTAPELDATLKNMTGDLKGLSTGPGSAQRNSFVSGVNSFLGTNFDASKVANQESFNKMAAQVVARQRQMMGLSGTDQQLSMIEHASPGSQLSQLGNRAQIAIIKGNNDYLMAENKAWQNAKNAGYGPEKFSTVMGVLNTHMSPLPFQMQNMSTEQRNTLLSAMSKAERAKADAEVSFARRNKLIPSEFPK